jgi:hypothetical protein
MRAVCTNLPPQWFRIIVTGFLLIFTHLPAAPSSGPRGHSGSRFRGLNQNAPELPPREASVPSAAAFCTFTSPYYEEIENKFFRQAVKYDASLSESARILANACYRCLFNLDEEASENCPSQNKQERFLFRNFYRCMDGPGTYVDVGAHVALDLSATWAFDQCLGWSGLCIEPHQGLAANLSAAVSVGARTCKVMPYAASISSGKLASLSGGHTALGSLEELEDSAPPKKPSERVDWFSPGFKPSKPPAAVAKPPQGEPEAGLVVTRTMGDILLEAGWISSDPSTHSSPIKIDMLSLDVEGHELISLMSIPWNLVDIRFAVVENIKGGADEREYLFDKGFALIHSISIDDIYGAILPGHVGFARPHNEDYKRRTTGELREVQFKTIHYVHKALLKGWRHVLGSIRTHRKFPET